MIEDKYQIILLTILLGLLKKNNKIFKHKCTVTI